VSEDEDVVGADFLEDFDVGAVEGADGERAVERELQLPVPELPCRRWKSAREIGGGMMREASETGSWAGRRP